MDSANLGSESILEKNIENSLGRDQSSVASLLGSHTGDTGFEFSSPLGASYSSMPNHGKYV